jgi:hypothetical protein
VSDKQTLTHWREFEYDPREQGVLLLTGDPDDGIIWITDKFANSHAGLTDIQRAVFVARLRALADELESA